jgi:hypothetical protein
MAWIVLVCVVYNWTDYCNNIHYLVEPLKEKEKKKDAKGTC